MGKLFLFGIGGTGSRVLRSLTMLLASGVKIDADEIVPVIIDADHANKDLTRTIELIKKYNSIRDKLTFDNTTQNRFWGTKINTTILPGLLLPLHKSTNDDLFKDYNTGSFVNSDDIDKMQSDNIEYGFKFCNCFTLCELLLKRLMHPRTEPSFK